MKKYLFVFLYIFIVFSPFANSQQEASFPQQEASLSVDMDASFADFEKKGMTIERFIDLLANPPWSVHPRIFSWIDELLERDDPAIDARLLRLLIQDRWAQSLDQKDLYRWTSVLIKRSFAHNKEITAMFEEEPWKTHFVSHIAKRTYENTHKAIMNRTNFREAVGYASLIFFTQHLQLKNNPRQLAWAAAILTEWEISFFEQSIADAFRKIDYEDRLHWTEFDDFDRLTELLLIRKSLLRPSTTSLLQVLPENKDPRMLDRILLAARNTSSAATKNLIRLLNNHLSSRRSSRISNLSPLNNDDVEAVLHAISFWLEKSSTNNSEYYYDDLIHTLTHLIEGNDIGFDDPRISTKIGQILESNNLHFSTAISLLNTPGWREHPNAPNLLIRLAQKPMYDQLESKPPHFDFLYSGWKLKEIEELLANTFWQNHPLFKNRLGRMLQRQPSIFEMLFRISTPSVFKPVNYTNLANSDLCKSALHSTTRL